jgi:ABC-type uncharacterized transport system involved in gliding motility auxiliary subunit
MDSRQKKRKGTETWSWLLGGIGTLLSLSFVIYALSVEAIEQHWIAIGVVGTISILSWIFIERRNLLHTSQQRGIQNHITGFLLTGLALIAIIIINIIAVRYNQKYDFTKQQRYTLSEQSISILQSIQTPIQVKTYFTTSSPSYTEFQVLQENLEQETTLLEFSNTDPLKNPLKAQQDNITSEWGTIILQSGENTMRLEESFHEETVVNALTKILTDVRHAICFTQGHQELDIEDTYNPMGMGLIQEKLQGQNYSTSTVNLMKEGRVPTFCEVLIVAGPRSDFFPPEYEMIAQHVSEGRHLFVMIDPAASHPLAADLERYGVYVGDDIILEQNPKYTMEGGDISYILLDQESFDIHPTIKDISMVLLQGVRSVNIQDDLPGISWTSLARTTDNSWAEKEYEMGIPEPNIGEDQISNISLWAIGEIKDPKQILVGSFSLKPDEDSAPTVQHKSGSKIVVIGSSSLINNAMYVQAAGNGNLFLNTIAWLVGEDAQIGNRADENEVASIEMNTIQGLLIWIFCLIIAPGIFLLGSIHTWRRRREK